MEAKKNVGIWIRVSTDMQVQGDSPEHHERRARMYAEAKGWNVITVYQLDALSGKSIMQYSETKRMLHDLAEGNITGLIFSKLARLARNTKELLEISEIFRGYNADLISLAESIDTSSPAGRLFYTMIAAMAQWEREEIAERVAASVPIRAKMGKPLGGQASFGYKWEGKELVIDANEAPIRKVMYELFLKTKRKKATASELNRMGYRTRNGSLFSDTTILRLLQDPTAKGIRRANYTRSTGEGKKWVIKPEAEWVEIPCPAIISAELWDECNALIEMQTKRKSAIGPKVAYLLSGFVHCSCGAKMYVYNENPVYKCTGCKRKIAVEDMDEIFHEQLKTFLLVDGDVESIAARTGQVIQEKQILATAIATDIQKLRKRLEIQWNLRVAGEIEKEDFQSFYAPLKEQLKQLEDQLPELEAEIDFLKIQQLSSETVIEEAKDLYANWVNLSFDEKRSIIETITDHIEVGEGQINIALAYLPASQPLSEMARKGNAGVPLWLL
ncbi:recombinase family protein [Limnovirga soli]|uniref:Recombinase family protein n=1 Tax=Limnovirga soli TaxID=2656915 RepID=A0A8J8F9F7_9BACT|nr:recombinase family protein [Limnovirga soli]NNV53848.1 recombinase family protein [Limnovirga soli]